MPSEGTYYPFVDFARLEIVDFLQIGDQWERPEAPRMIVGVRIGVSSVEDVEPVSAKTDSRHVGRTVDALLAVDRGCAERAQLHDGALTRSQCFPTITLRPVPNAALARARRSWEHSEQ